ncbi:unnamed protein product [Vicia faba]|uniref:Uncharacterized protein n=1 Tax=Vicia faba TaxID=3906 RepID=A0AAV1A894_VICFA|nr:unnamed protein product [Vicia faba]
MTQVGPFKGFMAWDNSSIIDCHSSPTGVQNGIQNPRDTNSNLLDLGKVIHHTQYVFKSMCKLLNPSPKFHSTCDKHKHDSNSNNNNIFLEEQNQNRDEEAVILKHTWIMPQFIVFITDLSLREKRLSRESERLD